MYTVKNVPNGVLTKTRFLGVNSNKSVPPLDNPHKSISPPNEKLFVDSIRKSPSIDKIPIGPRPVFLAAKNGSNTNRRKPRVEKRQEKEVKQVKPDAEVVSFFAVAWNSLQANLENSHKNNPNKDVVYYRPHETAKIPDFTPCNYERVWADHHYRKLINHIEFSMQNQ